MAEWWETSAGRQRYAGNHPGVNVAGLARRRTFANSPFFERAKAMFPGMPDWLIRSYARGLTENAGSPGANDLAWAEVRSHARYDTYFAGNRREDGSFRMSEMEYLATKDAYSQMLASKGLNPQVWSNRFGDLIGGDVSPAEFKARLDGADHVWNAIPQVAAWYASNYGLDLTPEAIYASFIDPQTGDDILNRRIGMADIGGAAAAHGFTRTAADAERLFNAGLSGDAARDLYTQAEDQLPTLNTLAGRFNDADSDFGIEEFEDAALGDVSQQQRARRLQQAEQASFTGGGRVRSDQSGGLSGLRQQ